MSTLAATLLLLAVGQSAEDVRPHPLPVHYAADARTYLLAELLRRGGPAPFITLPRGTTLSPSAALLRASPVPPSAAPWIRLLTIPAEAPADRIACELLYARLELADVKSQTAEDDTGARALAARVARLESRLAELRAGGAREDKTLLDQERRILRAQVERELSAAEQQMTAENPRLARLRQRAKAVLPLL